MNKYAFRKYNKNYKKLFLQEKVKLGKILGFLKNIEHVGSTSILGLGGKGIIDIIIAASKNRIKIIKKKMEEAGYEFREVASTKDRIFFRRDYKYRNITRRVHIHLVEIGSKDYREHICFRDYLRINPQIVKEYADVKKQAVKLAKGDGEFYRKYKNKFIADITKKALKYFRK